MSSDRNDVESESATTPNDQKHSPPGQRRAGQKIVELKTLSGKFVGLRQPCFRGASRAYEAAGATCLVPKRGARDYCNGRSRTPMDRLFSNEERTPLGCLG